MENFGEKENSRRNFLKNSIFGTGFLMTPKWLFKLIEQGNFHTEFKKTTEKFKNGEYVYNVEVNGQKIGEFWPIHGINLVTRETDPDVFENDLNVNIEKMQEVLGDKNIVATAPDGMTTGSFNSRKLEGKCLSNGRPCGDGQIYNYGIIKVKKGFNIDFTHIKEINNFDNFYEQAKEEKCTLFFLPSIFRNGSALDAKNLIDKVFIRRDTIGGPQIGVMIFDQPISGNEAREMILGLDREDKKTNTIKSKTTHIYVLDGGPIWGQSAKEIYNTNDNKFINSKIVTKGERDPKEVTNYLVFY